MRFLKKNYDVRHRSHPAVDVPDTSTPNNPTVDDAQPYHHCHQQCNLLGCFATAPWVEQIQNGQDEQCCAYELLHVLLRFVDSSSGLGRVLRAAGLALNVRTEKEEADS